MVTVLNYHPRDNYNRNTKVISLTFILNTQNWYTTMSLLDTNFQYSNT